ncbi:MAG: hypothetical protein GDA36_01640 [Rhodobacteraceae bacterium]|nr:hypothetical protein [Paracoccaceae bacterium]
MIRDEMGTLIIAAIDRAGVWHFGHSEPVQAPRFPGTVMPRLAAALAEPACVTGSRPSFGFIISGRHAIRFGYLNAVGCRANASRSVSVRAIISGIILPSYPVVHIIALNQPGTKQGISGTSILSGAV